MLSAEIIIAIGTWCQMGAHVQNQVIDDCKYEYVKCLEDKAKPPKPTKIIPRDGITEPISITLPPMSVAEEFRQALTTNMFLCAKKAMRWVEPKAKK